MFLDEDFGPKDKNDKKGSMMAMYKNGEIPMPGYPVPDSVTWMHAEEFSEKGTVPQFVDDGAGANDVR